MLLHLNRSFTTQEEPRIMNRAHHHRKFQLCSLLLGCWFGLTTSVTTGQDSQPQNPAPSTQPAKEAALEYVRMTTNHGDIILELNREKAPISVANFLAYVDREDYDGTIFHRVMSNFMIQGGGFTEEMEKKKARAPIKNEWRNGLKNVRGSIAMARRAPADSATNQFFINTVDNDGLDVAHDGAAYAVFGKVFAGMDTVDSIRSVSITNGVKVKGGPGTLNNVPLKPVVIETVRHIPTDEAKALEGKSLTKQEKPTSKPEN
jgi:cyclophilin family peptidyl-prolyl cis-trans isomerase